MSDSIKDELLEEINRNGVTIFCGAGISYQHPSNIPLSFDIKLQIIKSILSSGPNYLKTVYAKNRTEIEKKANSLLLEKLFQILFEFEGYRIRELFEIFNSSSPNQYHKIIAKLAEKGFVKNIITTNFDNLIELELDNHNIGYKKILNYSHLKNKRVSLIKLHGSIDQLNDEFDNFIITLKQVGKGLGAQKSKLLTNIFRKYSTLFVGWSDNDIDITPHLLSSGLKPFYWLHFSKSSKKKIFRKSKINNFHDKSIAYIIKNNNGSIIDCNPQTFLLEILNRLSIEITNDNNESVKSRKSFGSIINDWTLTISTRSRFLLLSELFRTLGKYKTAINLINYYKREFLDERNQFENAILLHDKAHSYQKKGDSLRAVKLYEASNTFCQGGDKQIKSMLEKIRESNNINLLSLYSNIGQSEKSLEIFDKINRKNILPDVQSKIYSQIATVQKNIGNYEDCISYLKQSIEIKKKLGDIEGYCLVLINRADVLIKVKKYDRAREDLDRAKGWAEKIGNEDLLVLLKGNLSNLYLKIGQYKEANNLYMDIIKLCKTQKNYQVLVNTLQNLGTNYFLLNNYSKCKKYYSEAIRYAKKMNYVSNLAEIFFNLAIINLKKGKTIDANNFLYDSERYYTKLNNSYMKKKINQIKKSIK